MKAIYLVRYGESNESFEMREAPVPIPGKGEVLIKVASSGLNYADVMARRGLYKPAPANPGILGYDVAGTIEHLGADVTGLKAGQRVAAMTRFGGYAEYAVTQAAAVIPIPDSMDFAVATSLATQASTAVYSSSFATRIYPGERVLIHAAAGGVGTILVQLAKAKGCLVYGSASLSKHDYLIQSGVDFPINSKPDLLWTELETRLAGQKIDAIFDNIGGVSFKKGFALLAKGGRIITYGAAAQNKGNKSSQLNSIRVGLGFGFYSPVGLIGKSQSILGVNMLALADYKPNIMKEIMEEVGRLSNSGIIRPVLGKSFPATQMAEAHDFLESRKSIGKVAINW